MFKIGFEPFLECSSKGDKRFSAFYARIKRRNNKSIEELYQAYKLFPNMVQGLTIKDAKGLKPINIDDCRKFYSLLWDEYLYENPELIDMASNYNGFTDMFGKVGHACQAEEIFRIVMNIKGIL